MDICVDCILAVGSGYVHSTLYKSKLRFTFHLDWSGRDGRDVVYLFAPFPWRDTNL